MKVVFKLKDVFEVEMGYCFIYLFLVKWQYKWEQRLAKYRVMMKKEGSGALGH